MKRKLITLVIITVCFLLQSTVLRKFAIGNICPNLLIIVTASLGFMRGTKSGMYVGLVCGLFIDLFWGGLLGRDSVSFFNYMLQGDFTFGTHLFQVIIPELVYTILVTLVLYQIILHINKRLEEEEQRSASKFV